MKAYKPESLVAVSRYQNYFPTLPADVQKDVYARMEELIEEEKQYCDNSAFIEKEIENRSKQAKWSRDHIDEYPMNWYYCFENVPGKDEYYITHKQCGICKLTKQEHCEEITKYLCMMDYYTFEMQGAVLDRTKTLGWGDDECNFQLMSHERAEELGFVQSPDAK